MQKELIIGGVALAMFIICPRMAGMVHVISRHSSMSIYLTALIGSVMSIPFVLLMVYIFVNLGIWAALGFCVLTDLVSVLVIKETSVQASMETMIIALFVIAGVKVAPVLSGLLLK